MAPCMVCNTNTTQRCKNCVGSNNEAYYCSKQCQRKDWGAHKRGCGYKKDNRGTSQKNAELPKEIGSRNEMKFLENTLQLEMKNIQINNEDPILDDADHLVKGPNYRCAPIQDKGMGMIATRSIEKGALVLEESPVLWTSGIPRNFTAVYENQFLRLSKFDQHSIMGLSHSHSSGEQDPISMLKDIFSINAFALEGGKKTGLLLLGSRLNHSCLPNVAHTSNDSNGKEQFYALCDIKEGDELCHCYIQIEKFNEEVPPTIENSRLKLMSHGHDFICNCELCGMQDKEEKSKIVGSRVKYVEIYKQMKFDSPMEDLTPKAGREHLKLCKSLLDEMKLGKIASIQLRVAVVMEALDLLVSLGPYKSLLKLGYLEKYFDRERWALSPFNSFYNI